MDSRRLAWGLSLLVPAATLALGRLLDRPYGGNPHVRIVSGLVSYMTAAMLASSAGVALLWLVRGPAPGTHLIQHPGFSGPAVALGVSAPLFAARIFAKDPEFFWVFPAVLWFFAGPAVAAFWFMTVPTTVWRPILGRRDGLGRLLGVAWIAGAALFWLVLALD